jgi:quinol-cytochrome oxidoreductase complex cytochrome b subunit
MELMGTVFFMLGAFLFLNFVFALLYILTRSGGNGFYRWVTYGGLLSVLYFPIMGLTQWAATSIYERFNWFVARVLILLYAIFIFIIVILCFTMFGYLAGKV